MRTDESYDFTMLRTVEVEKKVKEVRIRREIRIMQM